MTIRPPLDRGTPLRHGLWIAVVLLVLAPWAIAADSRGCTFTQKFSQEYSISTTGRVKLKSDVGPVYIRGDGRTTVLIEAIKTACNQAALDGTEIHVLSHPQNTERPEHLEIETRYSREIVHQSVGVEYHITVPRNVSLDNISMREGELEISDVSGRIHAKTAKGNVAVEGVESASQIGSGHGAVRVVFNRLTGVNRLTSVRGEISVVLPSDTNADIEANTGLSEISNQFGIPASDTAHGHSLTFRVGRGGSNLEMVAFAGAINIQRADDDKPLSAVVDLDRDRRNGLIW